jgi:vancomycin resistance protein VanJ
MLWRLARRSWWHAHALGVPLLLMAWAAGRVLGYRTDRWVLLFFLPSMLVALVGLYGFWHTRRRVARLQSGLTLLLSILAAADFVRDVRWHAATPASPNALRVAHWNIAYARAGLPRTLEQLAEFRPDVVFLSECRYRDDLAEVARTTLGLDHAFHDQGMAILSRYPFTPQGTVSLNRSARCWWARLVTPMGTVDLVTVDLVSHPFLNRNDPLRALADWVARRDPTVPLLMAGDFNTPRNASAFQPLRAHLQNGYEIAGRGWPYSWPLPLPLYSLDHLWISPGLHIQNYRLRASFRSDHLRQLAEVEIRPR